VGMKGEAGGSIRVEQRMDVPAEKVAAYIGDFRNAKEWMVGLENVKKLGEDSYRLTLESPIGRIEPVASIVEHSSHSIGWVYTSTIDGGGRVDVAPESDGCVVTYTGEFSLKRRLFDRAARLAGVERFARKNGERSLLRLKHLMEARRLQ
jgi:carbon monoxide dehydrogenase subunit G